MTEASFHQRFGLHRGKPITDDFPESARVALAHLLVHMDTKQYFQERDRVVLELYRTARLIADPQEYDYRLSFHARVLEPLLKMEWPQVYVFCERLYTTVLRATGYDHDDQWVETTGVAEIRAFFAQELAAILSEENIGYDFVEGVFQRRGRPQTQKSLARVGAVLADPAFATVRNHFNKARSFFENRERPDFENCVKEAVCALEAALETAASVPASSDFPKAVRHLQGNSPRQIPPPIAEAMVKLHAYRGGGQGVAHAATEGLKVSELEAELILSASAALITYLVDLYRATEEEIPF